MPAQVLVVDNASRVELPPLPGTSVIQSTTRLTLGAARNLGLAHVSTPCVIFWDADDVMLPGTLASLESAIAADPSVVAYGQAIVENPAGSRFRWPRRWISSLLRWPRLFAIFNCVWSVYPATGATIMRTDVVRSAGGYADNDTGDDWCLGVSLAFRGKLGWSERPGRLYRDHDGSITHRHGGWQDYVRRAHTVRTWIRNDPRAPAYVRLALPLIQAAQYAAVAGHLLAAGLRRVRAGRR